MTGSTGTADRLIELAGRLTAGPTAHQEVDGGGERRVLAERDSRVDL